MSDDIDIEEHDILDDPRIKNIFSDISDIKTEVLGIDEGNIDIKKEKFDTDLEKFDEDNESSTQDLCQNNILGLKHCENPASQYNFIPKLLQTSIVLKDWGVILNSSCSYCKSCQILFPTENAFQSHKLTNCSLLNITVGSTAISSTSEYNDIKKENFDIQDANMAVESEPTSSVSSRLVYEEDSTYKDIYKTALPDVITEANYECDFCDSVFDSETEFNIHKPIHNTECYKCKICSCHFNMKHRYISHVKNKHHVIDIKKIEVVTSNYKCIYCAAKFNDNKRYNNHIAIRHPDMYNKVINVFEEYISKASDLNEKNHKALEPMDDSDYSSNEDVLEPELSAKTENINFAIPISTLFKCSKCQIHFLSCSVAIEHEKSCALKNGDWKCTRCYRRFKKVDRVPHIQQHKLTDRFKVIIATDEIFYRLLYKCTQCSICHDEKSLLKYHAKGCSADNSVTCPIGCNSLIHKNAYDNHKKIHSEVGDNFKIIDVVCVEQMQSYNLKSLESAIKKFKVHYGFKTNVDHSPLDKKEKIYFYCESCQCFMRVLRMEDRHHIGKCEKKFNTYLCKLCGLRFSQKSFPGHKKTHKKVYSLHDLSFFDAQTKKKITPPIPDFKKCTVCSVHFFNNAMLKKHACNAETAKNCRYCCEKFSVLAHKLHVPFHEYKDIYSEEIDASVNNKPDINNMDIQSENEEDSQNILFQCETCDMVLDFYDDVVEHCQNHLANIESHVTKNLCSICDLNFAGNCYEKHKKLHATSSINKSAFKILVYKYENLLSENWNDIFNSLSKVQVDQILNKSKYKHTKAVRIELLRDGLSDLTMYQCDLCKAIVDRICLADHIENRQCIEAITHNCTKCPLKFASKCSLVVHENMHSTSSIDEQENMRILLFNSEKHLCITNDSLRSINEANYKKQVDYQKQLAKKNVGEGTPLVIYPQSEKADKTQTHNFYKCRDCGLGLVSASIITRHQCNTISKREQCPICLLWISSRSFPNHKAYHEINKIDKNNVKVIYFKNGKIEKNLPEEKKRFVFYQCVDCRMCLHTKHKIKRHSCRMQQRCQKICEFCQLPFNSARFFLHLEMHQKYTFTRKHVQIVEFKDKKIIKDL